MQVDFGGLEVIQDWGWTPIQLAEKVDQFRERTIKGMTPECFGDREFFGELMFENPDGWKIIYPDPRQYGALTLPRRVDVSRPEDAIVLRFIGLNWNVAENLD